MRLSTLIQFRRAMYAPGSMPSLSTLRARIREGKIPGGTIQGGRYYVDVDEFDRQTNTRRRIAAEQAEIAKDPRLKGLI